MTLVLDDPHRPRFHFLPRSNWMNDPNGLIQWRGEYHLFYQHNPSAPVWGSIHWGHAVSRDLVHWTHLPLALAPTPGGPDADGCWSGCAVDYEGVPTLLYTGAAGGAQVQCLARSSDSGLRTWVKDEGNPVLSVQPAGTKPGDFRDPFVWREGELWLMVLGAALDTGYGAALLYSSPDLQHWTYLHPLLQGDREEHGWMWECPNFFALRDKHVLLFSNGLTRQVFYVVGRFDGRSFQPETEGRLSADDSYAPLTFLDDQGRRILFGWIDEPRSEAVRRAAGWAGVASLPRILDLDRQGRLTVTPVPELRRLRGSTRPTGELQEDGTVLGLRGDALELEIEFEVTGSGSCGVAVRCSPDGREETVIVYDRGLGRLIIDRSRSSADPTAVSALQELALHPLEGDQLRLTVFVDRSVLEVFVRDGLSLTSRIYPTRPDSLGVRILTTAGARLTTADAWILG
nr:glycoside hydrolase family 32 protein [Deinococcus sp. Arct2-2]